jgi:hypothetical protein
LEFVRVLPALLGVALFAKHSKRYAALCSVGVPYDLVATLKGELYLKREDSGRVRLDQSHLARVMVAVFVGWPAEYPRVWALSMFTAVVRSLCWHSKLLFGVWLGVF